MSPDQFKLNDPVELAVFMNLVSSIPEEACGVVARTAYTTFVRETNDFSVAIASPDGTFFAYPRRAGVPTFIGLPLEEVVSKVSDWKPGDVLFTNDAYTTGGLVTHSPDLNLIAPVFVDGEVVALCWGFLHSSDVGGTVPGSIAPSNREIFQEGLRIPPTKLYKGGELNEELYNIIMTNVRAPEQLWGDLRALTSSFYVASERLTDIFAKFGVARSKELIDETLAYAEFKTRQAISNIPNGSASFVDYLDDDNISEFPVRIKLSLTVSDDEVHFDFTGTDPQVLAAFNLATAGKKAHSWLTLGFLQYLFTQDPEIPVNGGVLRPLHVNAPAGTLVHAVKPAAIGARLASGIRVMDVTFGALSQLIPRSIPAAGCGQGMLPVVSVPSLGDGGRKVNILQPLVGGTGGRPTTDGYDGTDYSLSFLKNTPIEIIESEMGVLVDSYFYICDSGGAGKYRGGLGVGMIFKALLPDTTIAMRGMERTRFAPWGANGGKSGGLTQPGVVNRGKSNERQYPKVDFLRLEAGETLELKSSGGGGYGNPLDRNPESVGRDVLFGYVSPAKAQADYGIVFEEGSTCIDEKATEAERLKLRASQSDDELVFDFGKSRNEYEAQWTTEAYEALNEVLSEMTVHLRVYAKTMIMAKAVGSVAGSESLTAAHISGSWAAVRSDLGIS